MVLPQSLRAPRLQLGVIDLIETTARPSASRMVTSSADAARAALCDCRMALSLLVSPPATSATAKAAISALACVELTRDAGWRSLCQARPAR